MKALNNERRDNPRLDLAIWPIVMRSKRCAERSTVGGRICTTPLPWWATRCATYARYVEKMLVQRQYTRDDIVIGDLPPVWTSLEARSG